MKGLTAILMALVGFEVVSGVHSIVQDKDNVQAAIFEQRDVTNHPRAVTIKNHATNYALKIDHLASANHDAVGIHCGPKVASATALGITASNTKLSTVKVTNDAAQTGGTVVGAIGNNAERTAPVFGAENFSRHGGIGYSHTAMHDGAVGFCSKSASPTQSGDHFQVRSSTGRLSWRVLGTGQMIISPEGHGLVLECIVDGKTIFSVDRAGNILAAGSIKPHALRERK